MEGSDANGYLFTGILYYMVTGLKSNVLYVLRAVPKVNLSGLRLRIEMETVVDGVMQAGFSVSMAFKCSNCVGQFFLVLILF